MSPADPLEGLEMSVLQTWLEKTAAPLRQLYKRSPADALDLENATRLAVFEATCA